jgi:hypothetical protein
MLRHVGLGRGRRPAPGFVLSLAVVVLLLLESLPAGAGPSSLVVTAVSPVVGSQIGSTIVAKAEASLEAGNGPANGNSSPCAETPGPTTLDCSDRGPSAAAASTELAYPQTRWGAEITYDASDGYALLYGGQNDTWAFEKGYWVDLKPKVIPPISSFSCLTYDWKDGYVVLFGGGRGGIGTPQIDRDTTWTFHGGVWTNVTNPSSSPPGLQYPSCTYDAAPGDGYVVLFGGVYAEGPTYTGHSYLTLHSTNQTWKFSGGKWTNLTNYAAPHPSARFGASMVYDSADGYVLFYGGAVNGTSTANGSCTPEECPHLNDTWKFAGGTWTNLTASASVHGAPPGRWEAGIANDTADGYVIIFGGQANGYKSYNATKNYTWAFSGGVWRNLSSTLSVAPGPRFGEAMGYDPAAGSVLMFSGLNSTTAAHNWNQTWEFHNGGWQDLSYILNFTESGLPSGTAWTSNVTSTLGATTSSTSDSTLITFGWTTGNYSYSISSVAGYHLTTGSATGSVSSNDSSISVGWSPERYTVRFTEVGLSQAWKTLWSVTLGTTTKHATGDSISFTSVAPGMHAFSVGAVVNYSLNRSYSGSVRVNATSQSVLAATVELRWTLVIYEVTFKERGLPNRTTWQVTFDGQTKSSTSAKITFRVSNGTYEFSASASGYTTVTGRVPVDGTSVSHRVPFVSGTSTRTAGPAGRHPQAYVTAGSVATASRGPNNCSVTPSRWDTNLQEGTATATEDDDD